MRELGTERGLEQAMRDALLQWKRETEKRYKLPDPRTCADTHWLYVELPEMKLASLETAASAYIDLKRIVFRKQKFRIEDEEFVVWVKEERN